jgi:L-alanine-DL-glutamate epimerase-like enolase superfamily enzyme
MRWLLLAAVIGVVVWIVVGGYRRRRRIAAQNSAFTAAHPGWDIFISPIDAGVIAVSEELSALILGSTAAWKRYTFDEISGVEILRDGDRVAGARRGTHRLDPEPSGALSAPTRNEAGIRSLEVDVVVDDAEFPDYLIEFFRSSSGRAAGAGNARLRARLEAAERFRILLFDAIRNQRSLDALPLGSSQEFARLRQLSEGTGPPLEEFRQQWASGHPGSEEPEPAGGS